MKGIILNVEGKEKTKIDLPKVFSSKIREDIVLKVLEAKKTKQPYGPNILAGKQYSAKGKIRHRRHVWQTHYGRGLSRVPRKVMSRRGTQFNWEAATVPFAKGGMRAHPPKPISMINTLKINKKELKIAFLSALSATTKKEILCKKYKTLDEKNIKDLPLIVEDKFASLKTKDLLKALKNILGEKTYNLAIKKKTQRAGVGKLRGRKYKKNAGALFVLGEKQEIKTKAFDTINVKKLSTNDLAQGGLGRLTFYTEEAIKFFNNLK